MNQPADVKLRKSRTWPIWLGLGLLILLLQWPLVKDLGARAMGIEPPKDNIPWRSDFAAAAAEAKHTGKPMLVDFTASWCPPCREMKRSTWPDAKVHEAVTTRSVPVLIDVDAQPDIARRYGVALLPTVMLLDGEGVAVKKAVGLLEPSDVIEMLP